MRLLSHRHAAQLPPSVKAAQGSPGRSSSYWEILDSVTKLLQPHKTTSASPTTSLLLCWSLHSDLSDSSLQPLHVVCPEPYTQPPLTQSHRSDLMLELQPPPMPYRRCSVLNLPFRRRYERVYIMPEVRKNAVILKGFGSECGRRAETV